MKAMPRIFSILLLICSVCFAAEQRFANLGDFVLESGETIRDCRVGYRTYGELNPGKSNAVLWPTWFSGNSEQLAGMIGPQGLADDSRYFVITVDAIGNGISCSPSNSRAQPGGAFPRFSIGDMVRSQHRLLTERLGIRKLHAVIGISMGGMQTFEWMTAYPDFMEKAVPIVGTTRQTSMDLLLWGAELHILEAAQNCGCGRREAMRTVGMVHTFALETPDYRVRETPPPEYEEEVMKPVRAYGERNGYDWASQLRAMMDHDIARSFAGSMEAAAKTVKAEVLVVVASQDHMVNPAPALEFAGLLGADTLSLEGDCGHRATGCESGKLHPAVRSFLNR